MNFKNVMLLFSLSLVFTNADASLSYLKTSGNQFVDAENKPVYLRGFNLGSLFPMEPFMSPVPRNNGTAFPDSWSIMNELQSRFGSATEQDIMNTYQESWINNDDMVNIHKAGYNVIRIPVWWGQFYSLDNTSPSGWRKDAFNQLDRIISAASQNGIYSIIDMHGAVKSQSFNASTGRINYNQYWTDTASQQATQYMWQQIASHYAGNSDVAGYDLLNEPDSRKNRSDSWTKDRIQAVIDSFNSLYSAIRKVDSDHIIFIEDTFDAWNLKMLPAPSQMGWCNVAYEAHVYPWPANAKLGETHLQEVQRVVNNTISDINAHSSWNIPVYIGEFNALDTSTETWNTMLNAFNQASLSWTMWSYKSSNSPVPNYWGWYDRTGWPGTPDIINGDPDTINKVWSKWTTAAAFQLNEIPGINSPSGLHSFSERHSHILR